MKTKQPVVTLSTLLSAEQVCSDCGNRYGKYSVGCSSVCMGTCDVCGKKTGVTEVRDYGYLQHGINQLKQNGTPAMKSQIYPEPADTAPYEQGEITLKLSEEEVAFLNECLDTIGEFHPSLTPASHDPSDVRLFERLVEKIEALYQDNCVRYELAPAMKAYVARYGSIPGPDDDAKWEVFRDTYNWMVGEGAGNG